MRMYIGTVVFVLFIALVLNVVVAWLCAYYAVPGYRGSVLMSADEFDRGAEIVTERNHELAVAGWTAFGVTELDCFGPWYELWPESSTEEFTVADIVQQLDMIINENVPDHNPLKQNGLRHQLIDMSYRSSKHYARIDAGWPIRSFRGFVSGGVEQPVISQIPPPPQKPQVHDLIARERPIGKGTLTRHLPYGPIWPGLIVNTLLYATVLIAVMSMWFAARSKLRLRRGLCPSCKYPIGVSEVCTECGVTLTESAILRARARRPEAAR